VIRKVALIMAAGFALVMGTLALVIINPAGGGGQSSQAASSVILAVAAANAKEGQGDLTSPCAPDSTTPGNAAGASIAAKAAARAGFTGHDLLVAVAVAGAESGWNPNATHLNDDGSTDFGMWQINSVHAELLASGDWQDPYSNGLMAYQVWKGSGWGAWTTYTSGAYLTRITAAMAALGSTDLPDPCSGPVPGGVPGQGEGGLTPWTVAAKRAVAAEFPGVTIGCYRTTEDGGEHPRGRACDIMNFKDAALGLRVAAWVQAHAGALHMKYEIHNQAILSTARWSEGWRPMEDRGGPTSNHLDHTHLSILCAPSDAANPNTGCPE